jgi:hypothetical protein
LELEHGLGPDWLRMQRPLCLDFTEIGHRLTLNHPAEHLEDIAAVAIPHSIDSDVESQSGPDLGASSMSDKKLLDKWPDQRLDRNDNLQTSEHPSIEFVGGTDRTWQD